MPIAAYARLISQKSEVRSQKSELQHNSSLVTRHSSLIMDGLVGNLSGDTLIKGSIKGRPDDAEKLGIKLAEELLLRGAGEILAEIYKK